MLSKQNSEKWNVERERERASGRAAKKKSSERNEKVAQRSVRKERRRAPLGAHIGARRVRLCAALGRAAVCVRARVGSCRFLEPFRRRAPSARKTLNRRLRFSSKSLAAVFVSGSAGLVLVLRASNLSGIGF